MRRAGVSKPCLWRWQRRFREAGGDGLLHDKTRKPGKAPILPGSLPGWKSPAHLLVMPSPDALAPAAFECLPDQSPQDIASVGFLDQHEPLLRRR
jgi:leucine-zipper of insertion element IS481